MHLRLGDNRGQAPLGEKENTQTERQGVILARRKHSCESQRVPHEGFLLLQIFVLN